MLTYPPCLLHIVSDDHDRIISIPTFVSIAEDALDAVLISYCDASLAMGAPRWQTIWRVTLPADRWGVLTAVMLGMRRDIGEIMTVMMVTGNVAVLQTGLGALIAPVRTLTSILQLKCRGN